MLVKPGTRHPPEQYMAKDERERLINKLKRYFAGSADDPELEEFEIIEAFDYAGDENDYELQSDILEYALKRYPESDAMLIRKAFYLRDSSDAATADRIIGGIVDKQAVLYRLYLVTRMIDNGEPAYKSLENMAAILSENERFGDEDVIKFCEVASLLDDSGYTFLKRHLEEIKGKIKYLPTLIFEMSQISRQLDYLDDTETYIEELTMIEPFEIDYWEMLAELHIQREQWDKAESDIEYAMAINPRSERSMLLRANVELAGGADPDEVAMKIHELIYSDKFDCIPLLIIVSGYDSKGKHDVSKRMILRYLDLYPGARAAVDALMFHNPDKTEIKNVLDRFYDINGDNNEFFWNTWGESHLVNNNFNATAEILLYFDKKHGLEHPVTLIKALYYSNRLGEMVQYIISRKHIESIADPTAAVTDRDPFSLLRRLTLMLYFIMGLARTNNETHALSVIESELSRINSMMCERETELNITVMGYKSALMIIKDGITSGTYPDKYDPILMPLNLDNNDA